MEWPWRPIQSPNKGRKKGERLRGETDQIKYIYLGFERRQVVGLGKLASNAKRNGPDKIDFHVTN